MKTSSTNDYLIAKILEFFSFQKVYLTSTLENSIRTYGGWGGGGYFPILRILSARSINSNQATPLHYSLLRVKIIFNNSIRIRHRTYGLLTTGLVYAPSLYFPAFSMSSSTHPDFTFILEVGRFSLFPPDIFGSFSLHI